MTLLKLSKPGVGGHQSVKVGNRCYGVPQGSRVQTVEGGRLAWVLDPTLHIYAFTAHGAVDVPTHLQELVRANLFGAPSP